ncbi:MAG: hypothetical protein IPO49_15870 [Bacteroidetes bacterium]|nr:hypothetical protein [Bacteroidota bacterium]
MNSFPKHDRSVTNLKTVRAMNIKALSLITVAKDEGEKLPETLLDIWPRSYGFLLPHSMSI